MSADQKQSEKDKVKQIIQKLRKKKLDVRDIPEEYAQNKEIIAAEIALQLRRRFRRGFDIISGLFFVEEEIDGYSTTRKATFENFDDYFEYLDGDVYDDACYRYFCCPESTIMSRNIDIEKLQGKRAFIIDTIDGYTLTRKDDEYKQAEKRKKRCINWFKKFNSCDNYAKFVDMVKKYKKTDMDRCMDLEAFFYNYVLTDITDKNRFNIVMQYMATGEYPSYWVLNNLCIIYDANEVLQAYNSYVDVMSTVAKVTKDKHKRALKNHILQMPERKTVFIKTAFYDETYHLFVEGIKEQNPFTGSSRTKMCRYFESFDEFVEYRKGDLTGCDLSRAINLDVSMYKTDNTTKMPISLDDDLEYKVQKFYSGNCFWVKQEWKRCDGVVVKEYKHKFDYFVDFVSFLKGDLSGADLILCDGLINLPSWDDIDFSGTRLRSIMCKKFGVSYAPWFVNQDFVKLFEDAEKSEVETALALSNSRDAESLCNENNVSLFRATSGWNSDYRRVDYISDLHLMHRIMDSKCESWDDVIYVVYHIAKTMVTESGSLLLIAGDVASDYEVFELFVKMLYKVLKQRGRTSAQVVFVLGNHELWDARFTECSVDQIAETYRALLSRYGMYLLHNDLLYYNDVQVDMIRYDELCSLSNDEIRERLCGTRYAILGGMGFSGYNEEFNADKGIYLSVLNRNAEIAETKKFEALYNRLCPFFSNTNVIIMTHMKKDDWSKADYMKDFVYINGHTHRNFFYDDGECRVYADNQIGYHNNNPHMKSLLLDNDYDYFVNYEDGIYEITNQQYRDFYRGKNISMTFTREVNVLYMLKKGGYYCFIYKNNSGSLSILNGGAPKALDKKDIQYYYDNMGVMISVLKSPLDKFSAYQEKIAAEIKKIGGNGRIHGCIIDIDELNHVYVNPIDGTITSYWALDIIYKIVYPSFSSLLQQRCPELYGTYLKMIEGDTVNPLVVRENTEVSLLPQEYFDTDIYRASREIKKMQKLGSNILASWNENLVAKENKAIGINTRR